MGRFKYFFIFGCILPIVATMNNCSPPKSSSPSSPNALEENELVFSSKYQRYKFNPVVNPRDLISPVTQSKKVMHAADPCAFWDEDESLWRVFFSFWDLEAENTGKLGGLWGATSSDGINFTPPSSLVLNQLGSFDSESTETCDIVKAPDPVHPQSEIYFLYFSGNSISNHDTPYHKIGLATSKDGLVFDPISPSSSPKNEEGLLFTGADVLGGPEVPGNYITDPTVLFINNKFYMWTLCIKQIPEAEANGGICYHESMDGINWVHHGLTSGLTTIAFPIQPSVYFNHKRNRFEMIVVADTPAEESEIHDVETNLTLRVKGWYQAHSSNGKDWTYTNTDRVFLEDTDILWENGGLATGGDVAVKNDHLYFYYPSFTSEGGSLLGNLLNWPLNLATKKLE